MSENPLYTPQNETAGGDVFSRYKFQYNWALNKIITEHNPSKEYAIFMEYHEDVVLSNSLINENARFKFYQIKTNNVSFNSNKLVTKSKGKNSILGKLLKNTLEKVYFPKIDEIYLVAILDYSLKVNVEDMLLDNINKKDLSQSEINVLEKALSKELQITELPSNLYFSVSELKVAK